VVVWKTDDPGVELSRRVVFDKEIISHGLSSPEDLDGREFTEAFAFGVEELVLFLDSLFAGPPLPTFLPLDRLFINTIEAALDYPIDCTAQAIKARIGNSATIKREVQRWMRESQRWVVAESTMLIIFIAPLVLPAMSSLIVSVSITRYDGNFVNYPDFM
jgi:hypothetical protein